MENKEIQQEGFEKKGFKSLNFLGTSNLFTDIKDLSRNFKILLVVGGILIVFFNFFNLTGTYDYGTAARWFAPLAQYQGILHETIHPIFGNSKGAAIAVTILYSMNGLAAITGLFSISMIVDGKTSQYFWGLINAIFFGAFAITVGYMGDVIMNIILIIGAPLGWYLMEIKKIVGGSDEGKGWKFKLLFYTGIVALIALMVTAWYFLLPPLTGLLVGAGNNPYEQVLDATGKGTNGSALLWLDSLTQGSNTVGYGMQLMNMGQQFYVWFFVNILKFLKFASVAGSATLNINIMLQFAVWFVMSLVGLYKRNLETVFQKITLKLKNK